LGLFLRVSPSPLLHRDVNEACMTPDEFEFQVAGRGCGAILMSNPANPTGQSIEGDNLRRYVQVARDHQTAIVMDEFYSYVFFCFFCCCCFQEEYSINTLIALLFVPLTSPFIDSACICTFLFRHYYYDGTDPDLDGDVHDPSSWPKTVSSAVDWREVVR
jgi:hypothetical protein